MSNKDDPRADVGLLVRLAPTPTNPCLARRDGADLGVAQRLFSLELLGRERPSRFF